MSIDTFFVILLVWTIVGLLAAVAFGRAIGPAESSNDIDSLLSSTGTIKYLRRRKPKLQSEHKILSRHQHNTKQAMN